MRILGGSDPQYSKAQQTRNSEPKEASKKSDSPLNDSRMTKKEAPVKNLSDEEIIAKLKAKKSVTEAKEAAKSEVKVEKSPDNEEEKDLLLKSDIGTNNPNDPTVKEKLKDILKSGAFSFNQKEKDVLSKIL